MPKGHPSVSADVKEQILCLSSYHYEYIW